MRNFHAKTACDSRIYEYLLPSYTLMARKPIDPAFLAEQAEKGFVELPLTTPEEMAEKRAYRVSDEQLEKVRSILHGFEGTNNFHNYTIGRHFNEAASTRYITSFKVILNRHD